MKTKPTPELENESLDEVTFEQAKKLQAIGFDWKCEKAYDVDGKEVNWTTKQFFCWKPTIALALKFVRKRFGIYNEMYIRSWDEGLFGFNVAHGISSIDVPSCSLLEEGDDDEDGITSFDYDEAESRALDYSVRYILKDFAEDFAWIKSKAKVYRPMFGFKPGVLECKVISVDKVKRVAKIQEYNGKEQDEFWINFHKLYKTPQEAAKKLEELYQ